MKGIYPDLETDVTGEFFAVIYAPRRQRDRFPEPNVQIVDSADTARQLAQPANKRYAARVIGPSRSSEGVRLYYIVHWLD